MSLKDEGAAVRKILNIKLLTIARPGKGYWEATAEGLSLTARGETPDGACSALEQKLKELAGDVRVREVIPYQPKKSKEADAPLIDAPVNVASGKMDDEGEVQLVENLDEEAASKENASLAEVSPKEVISEGRQVVSYQGKNKSNKKA